MLPKILAMFWPKEIRGAVHMVWVTLILITDTTFHIERDDHSLGLARAFVDRRALQTAELRFVKRLHIYPVRVGRYWSGKWMEGQCNVR